MLFGAESQIPAPPLWERAKVAALHLGGWFGAWAVAACATSPTDDHLEYLSGFAFAATAVNAVISTALEKAGMASLPAHVIGGIGGAVVGVCAGIALPTTDSEAAALSSWEGGFATAGAVIGPLVYSGHANSDKYGRP